MVAKLKKLFLLTSIVLLCNATGDNSVKMIKFRFNKLIRDIHYETLQKKGSVFHCKTLNDDEYDRELRLKLLEESQEVIDCKTKEELIGELADLLEIIDSLQSLHEASPEQIRIAKAKKRLERGGFDKRIYVTIAEHPQGSYSEQYCRAQPEKYPEIIE